MSVNRNPKLKKTKIGFSFLVLFVLLLNPLGFKSSVSLNETKIGEITYKIPNVSANDTIASNLVWSSTEHLFENSQSQSLDIDALVGNITKFEPENCTSYTGSDLIEVEFQPSNASWSHTRDFEEDVNLPSTNMILDTDPYDTTVFFARNNSEYHLTLSWEYEIGGFSSSEANFILMDYSQFINFESYVEPWTTFINYVHVYAENADPNDYILKQEHEFHNSGLFAEYFNYTTEFSVTFNNTGWYYLVMWGMPGITLLDQPVISTIGELTNEGVSQATISTYDILDIYRPSLGYDSYTFTKSHPDKVYEKIIEGVDHHYGASLALIYVYEFPTRNPQEGLFLADYDWLPIILYVDPSNLGKFPNRYVYFFDYSWTDFEERYFKIKDPNYLGGSGVFDFSIDVEPEFAAFLNETVDMSASVSTSPEDEHDKIGGTIRASITTNSHGISTRAPNSAGYLYNWTRIPRIELTDSVLKSLYKDKLSEFLDSDWKDWPIVNLLYPSKTPFCLYFNQIFEAPYLVNGIENLLLIRDASRYWFDTLDIDNLFYNTTFQVDTSTTLTIPVEFNLDSNDTEPIVGEETFFTISMGEMGNPNITIDYVFDYISEFQMGLFSGSYNITLDDSMTFTIPLQEIRYQMEVIGYEEGLSGISQHYLGGVINRFLRHSEVGEFVSIENFTIGDHVVGNLVSCDIHLHLWKIIKFVIDNISPQYNIACFLVDRLILDENEGFDLIISPQLQGEISGNLRGDGLEFDEDGYFEFNATNSSKIIRAVRTVDTDYTFAQIQDVTYGLNFATDWGFEINFSPLPKLFGAHDQSWFLGTYPDIDFAEIFMPESSQILLNWGEYIPPDRKVPGYSIYLIVGVIVVVAGFYTVIIYTELHRQHERRR